MNLGKALSYFEKLNKTSHNILGAAFTLLKQKYFLGHAIEEFHISNPTQYKYFQTRIRSLER